MDELKKRTIWIVWRIEERGGRKTKVPYAVNGEKTGTDKTHSYQWVTFEEAQRAAQTGCFNGVGFIIPHDMFFLDIDKHNAQHKLSDEQIQNLLERFSSYSETSVSGTGIHIYGKVDLLQLPTERSETGKLKLANKYYQKNSDIGLELYFGAITNRFAVYTGNAINDVPLIDCTESVLETLDKEMKRKPDNSGQLQITTIDSQVPKKEIPDADIVSALRNQVNGAKFSKLYDGDFSDYPSQSEADIALCNLIAFRTGPDINKIDKIFRSSRLYRDKWERDDYRKDTIQKAIEYCHGDFHVSVTNCPPYNCTKKEFDAKIISTPYFVKVNEKTGEYYVDPPLLARYVRENLIYIFVQNNANQGLMIYIYDNGVYRLCNTNMFLGKIKGFIAEFDEELIKMSTVREVYQLLTTDLVYVSQAMLNEDESIINFENGVLHISETDLTLTSHTPDIFSTTQIPCNWPNKPSSTPVFDNFIQTLADGNQDVIQLLLEFIGACLSNVKGWRMKKSMFLVGDGDTGKSQLKSLVERLLGSGNFIGIDLNEIEARFGTGAIYGKRLAGSSDMSFMTVNELKTFKKLTGGDSLFAEFKGQQPFEFVYNGLLWFCMNRLPKFSGDDGKWVYDRIMVVECPNVIPLEEQDKRLLDKMYAEREGIVYKAITAFQKVIKNGYRFTEPEKIIMARKNYLEENNSVINFFNECMCNWPDGKCQKNCSAGKIYKVYVEWCKENNNGYFKTSHEFREELRVYLGIEKLSYADKKAGKKDGLIRKIKGIEYFINYGLTQEAKQQYAKIYGYDDDFSSTTT